MKVIKNKDKYILDFRFRDKRFRLTGFETERHSKRLADTIERLMEIYYSNDNMPLDMQRAVDSMPSRIVRKLGKLGMLSPAKTAEKNRLSDHLESFMESLKVKQ